MRHPSPRWCAPWSTCRPAARSRPRRCARPASADRRRAPPSGGFEVGARLEVGERGFDETTVAEIAERAALIERTFFRHYADKREVLFGGARLLQDSIVAAVDEAPAGLAPIEVLARAFAVAQDLFSPHPRSIERQRVIDAHPDLQERELIKLATLAAALAEALRRRGVDAPAAELAAEAGIAVFEAAFARWIRQSDGRDFARLVRVSLEELRAVTAD